MRIVLQRVSEAAVSVDVQTIGEIGAGILAFCGFGREDELSALAPMAEKLCNLRIFPDEQGRFHHSVLQTGGGILLVPQFTLFADTSKGRRPEFFSAKEPGQASEFFDAFAEAVRRCGVVHVACGQFGAHMQVSSVNDGPVTISLEN